MPSKCFMEDCIYYIHIYIYIHTNPPSWGNVYSLASLGRSRIGLQEKLGNTLSCSFFKTKRYFKTYCSFWHPDNVFQIKKAAKIKLKVTN